MIWSRKEIIAVKINSILDKKPEQYKLTVSYKDGTKEEKGPMFGEAVANKYYRYLNEKDKKRFGHFLTAEYKSSRDLKSKSIKDQISMYDQTYHETEDKRSCVIL